MASEITFFADEEVQFLSSLSLPNFRQALEENFLDSDSDYEDYTSDSDNGRETILDKSCVEDALDMSDEDSPLGEWKVLRTKEASIYEKTVEGESGRKTEKTSGKYFSPEDVQRLKGSRKDC